MNSGNVSRRYRWPKSVLCVLICVAAAVLFLFACSDDDSTESQGAASGWVRSFDELHETLTRHYPFTDHKGIDWEALRARFRPRIEAAAETDDKKAYYRAVREYAFSIPDGGVRLESTGGGWADIAAELKRDAVGGGLGLGLARTETGRIIVVFTAEGGPAESAGILPGAEILSLNGTPVSAAVADTPVIWADAVPATSEALLLEQLRFATRAPVGETVTIGYQNPDAETLQTADLTAADDAMAWLDRTDYDDDRTGGLVHETLASGYGYLKLPDLTGGGADPTDASLYPAFQTALEDLIAAESPGLILDLRNTGGADHGLAAAIAGFFYAQSGLYADAAAYDAASGRFETDAADALWIDPQTPRFDGPVVALVGPGCRGAGEGLARAVQSLPTGFTAGFFNSAGVFAADPASVRLADGLSVSYPGAGLLDDAGRIRIESDGAGAGGVGTDIPVPLLPETAPSAHLDSVQEPDPEADYALTALETGVLRIDIGPADPVLTAGETLQLEAAAIYMDGATLDVTDLAVWTPLTPDLAAMDAGGLLFARSPGDAFVMAVFDGIAGIAAPTVEGKTAAAAPLSLSIAPAGAVLRQGETRQFTAEATYADGAVQDATAQAEWTAANPAIATFAEAGLARGASPGFATVSAALNGAAASADLAVVSAGAALVSLETSPADVYIQWGETFQFTATATFSDGAVVDVTRAAAWSVSNPDAAAISAAGLAEGKAQGGAAVSAEFEGMTAGSLLTVTAPEAGLVDLEIDPSPMVVMAGNTSPVRVTGVLQGGRRRDMTGSASWRSSNDGVVSVGPGGLAQGRAAGVATLHASVDGIGASASVRVERPRSPVYEGTETAFSLERNGLGAYLLPVEIGSQTFHLKVDTNIDYMIVFKERISDANIVVESAGETAVVLTDDSITRGLPGIIQTGTIASAPVRIGAFSDPDMRFMVMETPESETISLTEDLLPDGVIGLRRTPGMMTAYDQTRPDAPLLSLAPAIHRMELNLVPPVGAGEDPPPATLTFGSAPLIAAADPARVFPARALGVSRPEAPEAPLPDFQAAFRAKTRYGGADADDLDILLSTDPIPKLILDVSLAERLGYDARTGTWKISEYDDLHLNLLGDDAVLGFQPAFKVWEVAVAPLALMGMNFEAIVGVQRWQSYVAAADYAGGETGRIDLLPRAGAGTPVGAVRYIPLPGVNTAADERFGEISDDGATLVYEQAPPGGTADIRAYRVGQGPVPLTGLNHETADDVRPALSGDGGRIAFASNRNGNWDIFLYDIAAGVLSEPAGVNTDADETDPALSADGDLLAFRRETPDRSGEVRLYRVSTRSMVDPSAGWFNTGGDESAPSLSADGRLVAFSGADRDDARGCSDLYIYDRETFGLAPPPPRINGPDCAADPDLGPDGRYIAFSADRAAAGDPDIHLLDVEAAELIHLPGISGGGADDGGPSVTAEGRRILFHSDRAGTDDLYLYYRPESEPVVSDRDVAVGGFTPAPDMPVTILDRNGDEIVRTESDGAGNFFATVPAGTAIPARIMSRGQDITLTTGPAELVRQIEGDVYAPEFQTGNIRFTDAGADTEGTAGFGFNVWFDLAARTPKYHPFIRVYLKRLAPGQSPADIDLEGFEPDVVISALSIKKMVHLPTDAAERQSAWGGDVVSEIRLGVEDGEITAHVEHACLLPPGVAAGDYAVVLGLNEYDFYAMDDHLQGEEAGDLADNMIVVPAPAAIAAPDNPNLRIKSAELTTNSFFIPENRPILHEIGDPQFTLNMTLDAMARDVTGPFDIAFQLEIDGEPHPLFVEGREDGNPVKMAQYPVDSALRADNPVGRTYSLYIDGEAYDALSARGEDTVCRLIVRADPDRRVTEWRDYREDNTRILDVMYLKARTGRTRQEGTKYGEEIFKKWEEEKFGTDSFNAGYKFGGELSYGTSTIGGEDVPIKANLEIDNRVWVTVFGQETTALAVSGVADCDIDNIKGSELSYDIYILGAEIWQLKKDLEKAKEAKTIVKKVYLSTRDDSGNEENSKIDGKGITRELIIGGIPVVISAGFRGEYGFRGEIGVEEANRFVMEAGPYAGVGGYAEGGIGTRFLSVGIGAYLNFIRASLMFRPSFQFIPSYPIAIIRFDAPFILESLDGRIYAWVRIFYLIGEEEWEKTLVEWGGYRNEFQLLEPYSRAWGAVDRFKVEYTNADGTLTPEDPFYPGGIYEDWGDGAPEGIGTPDGFTAEWTGYFNLNKGDYTFSVSKDGDSNADVLVDLNANGELGDDETIIVLPKPETNASKDFTLDNDGIREVKVNYEELGGDAFIDAYFTGPNRFTAKYYNYEGEDPCGCECEGTPALVTSEPIISHNWSQQSPRYGVVNPDRFTACYEGEFDFDVAGMYAFFALTDDGMRASIDTGEDDTGEEQPLEILNEWRDQAPTRYVASRNITKGQHNITVEYYENGGGAAARFFWVPYDNFMAALYPNADFEGDPAIDTIGQDELKYRERRDFYSARWEGIFNFHEDGLDPDKDYTYDFISRTNGGMQVWIDGEKILGRQNEVDYATAQLFSVRLKPVEHHIVVEYRTDGDKTSAADLSWSRRKENEYIATYWYTKTDWEAGNPPVLIEKEFATGDNSFNIEHASDKTDDSWPFGKINPISTNRQSNYGSDFYVEWEGDFEYDQEAYYAIAMGGSGETFKVELDHVPVIDFDWNRGSQYNTLTELVMPIKKPKLNTDDSVVTGMDLIHVKASFHGNKPDDNDRKNVYVKFEKDFEVNQYLAIAYDNAGFDPTDAEGLANDPLLYEDWGTDSPHGEVSADDFSTRHTGVMYIGTETFYTFFLETDTDDHGAKGLADKVIVYMDGDVFMEVDYPEAYQLPFTKTVKLSKGQHNFRIDYKEGKGDALIRFWWEEQGKFSGFYFNDKDLSGPAVHSESELEQINKNWGGGDPGHDVNEDNFSARWVGAFRFDGGPYQFNITHDDGFRLYIDGQLIASDWEGNSRTAHRVRKYVPPGLHTVKLEYTEWGGDAMILLFWNPCPLNEYVGEYYVGNSLVGDLCYTSGCRTQYIDGDLDLHSQAGYLGDPKTFPLSGTFTARYSKVFQIDKASAYEFIGESKSRMRVILDGKTIYDEFSNEVEYNTPDTAFRIRKYLAPGYHDLVVEYLYLKEVDNDGNVKLTYARAETDEWVTAYYRELFFNTMPSVIEETALEDGGFASGDSSQVLIDKIWGDSSVNPAFIHEETVSCGYYNTQKCISRTQVWDRFCDRWSGVIWFPHDMVYRFDVHSDDGVIIEIDGETVLDEFQDQDADFVFHKYLNRGYHDIQVRHYDRTGGARLYLEASLSGKQFAVNYYNNTELRGVPALRTADDTIEHDWGPGGPGNGVNNDNFSARWTKAAAFEDGVYQFNARYDDGIRVWLDDQLVMEDWDREHSSGMQARVYVPAGDHTVRVEYREFSGNAGVSVNWNKVDSNAFTVQYYNNRRLAGEPVNGKTVSATTDAEWTIALDHDWGEGSPAAGIETNGFSARYEGVFRFEQPGAYEFELNSDDDVRLWIEGEPVVNAGLGRRKIRRYISGGYHRIRVEHVEYEGAAHVSLKWIGCSPDEFIGNYYDNHDERNVSFDWIPVPDAALEMASGGYPKPVSELDHALWSGVVTFADPGVYEFKYVSQGGNASVEIDGVPLMPHPFDGSTEIQARRYLAAGPHTLTVRSDLNDPEIEGSKLWWSRVEGTPDTYGAAYYKGTELSGQFYSGDFIIKEEWVESDADGFSVMGNGWGDGGPFGDEPVDYFSARYFGAFEFAGGEYTFVAEANDGIRVWLDGKMIFNEWRYPQELEISTRLYLPAGVHDIQVQYFERIGDAAGRLKWKRH